MILNDRQSQIYSYTSRLNKHKKDLLYATRVIKNEVSENLTSKKFKSRSRKFISLTKTLTNSSIWISRSSIKYLKSYLDIKNYHNENLTNERSRIILEKIHKNLPMPISLQVEDHEIFRIIYSELMYAHFNRNEQTQLKPKIKNKNITIVLISGVFNEIFSTPAFQRGADFLFDKYQLKNININVSGVRDCKSNAETIKNELDLYCKENPNEKLWLVSFSKGGLDSLHYLKSQSQYHKKILGVSFIASPILGSEHVNHKVIKALNASSLIIKKISKHNKIIPLAMDFKRSLDADYRSNWFRQNHRKLPEHAFYTALALESKWYESHLWMILTKALFMSQKSNDGIVDVDRAQFPKYFSGINLGVLEGHHLIGTRSSFYNQEALLEAHLIFLNYKKLI